MRPHIQPGLLAHHTRTPHIYTNINTPMYKFYTGLTDWPPVSHLAPSSCILSFPTDCGVKACGSYREEAGFWRRERSCPPPPHRYLQRVLSLNGTLGQRTAQHTPALLQLRSQASPPSPDLLLPSSPSLHTPCFSTAPSRPWSPSGPSALFLSFRGDWGCGAALRRDSCRWRALCWGWVPTHSPPQGTHAGSRCPHTPGCRPGGHRPVGSGPGHHGSSRPPRTAGESTFTVGICRGKGLSSQGRGEAASEG